MDRVLRVFRLSLTFRGMRSGKYKRLICTRKKDKSLRPDSLKGQISWVHDSTKSKIARSKFIIKVNDGLLSCP